ncbi:MAG: cell filamentation protein Fic, partial [Myxococcales bacterium]|nr:cell filamentation protein Fic [Myxococcales bacterium]
MVTIRESVRDLDDRTDDLKDLASRHPDIWKDFLGRYELSWIHHENALEGIVVTHAEVTSALKGRPISLDTYPAIRNFRLAMDLVRSVAAEGPAVTHEMVLRYHATLGCHDPKYQVGRYRKDIPLHRTYFHDIAEPEHIHPRLEKLLRWAG